MLAVAAVGQESESTSVATTTGGPNLMSELWLMDDATPLATGQVDLRLTGRWVTGDAPYNRGDSDDDYVIQPSLVWGVCANVEVFASVPIWVGDGGDVGPLDEGNADTTVGFTWRMSDAQDMWPAMALKASVRIPTGDNSNGLDGELRLIMTDDYDGGLRSHLNTFVQSVNSDNDTDLRDVQYGIVAGMDGPLGDDGAVRWVADYMHRSSYHYGTSNMDVLEFGWEWAMSGAETLGMSFQINLDDNDDAPDFGASIAYSHSLTF